MSIRSRSLRSRLNGGVGDALAVVAALAWMFAFGWYFFLQALPNNPERLSRSELLANAHLLLLENAWPSDEVHAKTSGWRYCPQRLDLLATAAVVLAGAWGLGHLGLRSLGVRPRERGAVRTAFALGLGLAVWSLVTLGLGLCGMMSRAVFAGVIAAAVLTETALRAVARGERSDAATSPPRVPLLQRRFFTGSLLPPVVILVVAPFVLAMLLGSLLPPTDFDVKEYHLQGPKEWYQQGRITFLPHNVYTSFPFLTEMLPFSAMVLRGDSYRGALAGQAVLMMFAPLTALGLYAAGRFVSSSAGWLAALVYLTTPWVYRISIIAYAEGALACYLLLSVLALMTVAGEIRCDGRGGTASPAGRGRAQSEGGSGRGSSATFVLCGLMAGSALACKYPGLVSVVVPVGVAIVWLALRSRPAQSQFGANESGAVQGIGRTWKSALLGAAFYAAGVFAAFGPWALKNVVQTGNPVYPLAHSVFGGRDWDAASNAKWKRGHSPPVHLLKQPQQIVPDLWAHALDVAAKSDWQSPLVFGLALLTVFVRRGKPVSLAQRGFLSGEHVLPPDAARSSETTKLVAGLWTYTAWLFLTWWALTHRIDRFWVPMLPVVCLLAGIGCAELLHRIERAGAWLAGAFGVWLGRVAVALPVGIALVFNLMFVTSPLAGNNSYLLDERVARERAMTRSIAVLNGLHVPDGSRVLLVGEAEVFDAEFGHVYNTVFDESIFEEWCAAPESREPRTSDPDARSVRVFELRPVEEIRATFKEHDITHVFVNWLEILRYREPGSYGYTDFAAPASFRALMDGGVLERVPLDAGDCLREMEWLDDGKRAELHRFAPELQLVYGGRPAFVAYELFAVRNEQADTEGTEAGKSSGPASAEQQQFNRSWLLRPREQ